ncbi:MAG: hypothetical protein MZV65_17035 [Chromatiales bacterium]|nr:hypothetical protein [Chromatiales bacterium]
MSVDLSDVDVYESRLCGNLGVSVREWELHEKARYYMAKYNKVHAVLLTGIKPQTYEFQIRLFELPAEATI